MPADIYRYEKYAYIYTDSFPNIFVTYRTAGAKSNSRYTILMTMPKNCHANIKDGRESIENGRMRMRHPMGIVSDCIVYDQKTMGNGMAAAEAPHMEPRRYRHGRNAQSPSNKYA